MTPLSKTIARNAVGLGIFAAVTAGLIAITQQLTVDEIEAQRQRAQASALFEIIPENRHDNDMLNDRFTLEVSETGVSKTEASRTLGLEADATGYRARRANEITGVIIPATAPDGYAGPIRLMVGIDRAGELLGVRVLEHSETPGLGDKIEARKSDWIMGFTGKSLGNPAPEQWRVEKRGGAFDQFTGATITPDAVVTAVKGALAYFAAHRRLLLSDATVIPARPGNSDPTRNPDNDR